MKQYILLLLSLFIAGSSMAKIKVHGVVVTLKDGTCDTIPLFTMPQNLEVSGMEDPEDDDYITVAVSLDATNDKQFKVQPTITEYGRKFGTDYGVLIGDKPIDTNIARDYLYGYSINDPHVYITYLSLTAPVMQVNTNTIQGNIGTTYYVRAWCRVNGTIYYSQEQAVRLQLKCSDYCKDMQYVIHGKDYYVYDPSSFIADNDDLFSGVSKNVFAEISIDTWAQVMKNASDAEWVSLKNNADTIVKCDDGDVVFISSTDEAMSGKMREEITTQGSTPFYIKADLSALLPVVSSTTKFGCYATQPAMQNCDEKWNIPGNEYLITPPVSTTSSPRVAFDISHIMLPGKKYNIRLKIAPNTIDEESTKTLNFYVYLADGNGQYMSQDTYPSASTNMRYGNGQLFSVDKDGGVIELEYTPTKFVYSHALMLVHSSSTFTSSNRSKYEQSFRIIGIEVAPAE